MNTRDKPKTIVIPELDELAKTYIPSNIRWTKIENDIIKEYYNRVPIGKLREFMEKESGIRRTAEAIKTHAKVLRNNGG